MKRALVLLVALDALVLPVSPALCVIQEIADKDGNIKYYKYTDRKGSVVFTDSLNAIPGSVRKNNQLEWMRASLERRGVRL